METNKAMYVQSNRHRFSEKLETLRCILVHRVLGRNLLKHSKEIHSRPARTWFQDEKEKNNVVKKWREVRERSYSAAATAIVIWWRWQLLNAALQAAGLLIIRNVQNRIRIGWCAAREPSGRGSMRMKQAARRKRRLGAYSAVISTSPRCDAMVQAC